MRQLWLTSPPVLSSPWTVNVFLFQADTALNTGVGTSFILINGANAENIKWATVTTAAVGANSVLEGFILAGTSIAFGANSELHG
jgi:hypothetical protein